MTFDLTSVDVTCVTLPKVHCVQVPWKYIKLCGYSDPFCKKLEPKAKPKLRSPTPRWPMTPHLLRLHTTLYGSAAGCRSIQKTCALWKHGLTSKNTHSQLTYFCKSNINQTFTNGGGMIWRDCNFYRNQTLGRRIDHLFVFFWTSEIRHFDS